MNEGPEEDNPIKDESIDEYTITETSVGDNPYIKLNEDINFKGNSNSHKFSILYAKNVPAALLKHS